MGSAKRKQSDGTRAVEKKVKKLKVSEEKSKKKDNKDKKEKKEKKRPVVEEDVEMSDAESEIEFVPKEEPAPADSDSSENEMDVAEKANGEANGKPAAQDNPNKSRESHAAQKKLAQERKQAKPFADILARSKKIWEQIRRKDLKKDEKKKLIEELCGIIKGRVKELVFKHDASRIIQTAMKHGTKEQKRAIALELKKEYPNLAQSAYGRYLAVKTMEYGTAETRKMVVEEFYGHVRKLIKHKMASIVLEDIYRQYATSAQKAALLREFYGVEFAIFKDGDNTSSLKEIIEKNPDKRAVIMKALFDVFKSIVDKEAIFFTITHKAMLEYITNAKPGTEIEEFIELLKENVQHVAYTKEGAQVVMRCLAYGSAKDRKALLKHLKPITVDLAFHKSAYLVLLTCLSVLDDTKLTVKTFLPELEPRLVELADNPIGRISLLYPLVGPDPRLLHPSAIASLEQIFEIRKETSKKDPPVRQAELKKAFAPVLLKAIEENVQVLANDAYGSVFISETLLAPLEEDKTAAVQAVASFAGFSASSPADISAWAQRMLKSLAQGGHFNPKTKEIERVEPPLGFAALLWEKIGKANVMEWACGEAGFVVVGMLEGGEWEGKQELEKVLRKEKKRLEEAVEGGAKGAKVILSKL